MLNRAAIIIRPRQPLLDWVSSIDDHSPKLITDDLDDLTLFLISEKDSDSLDEWLLDNYRTIFEHELESWITDRSFWPERRDWNYFRNWIQVELHSTVIDLGDDKNLVDDGEW